MKCHKWFNPERILFVIKLRKYMKSAKDGIIKMTGLQTGTVSKGERLLKENGF